MDITPDIKNHAETVILFEKLKLPVEYGALITSEGHAIIPKSPADLAGIKEKDILLEFNGEKITIEKPMQDFLEKMGYRRIYCPLRVEASPLLQAVVRSGVHRWGCWLGVVKQLRGRLENLGQVAKLLEIANSCKAIPAGDGKQVQL